jgi:hypothetical protein
MVSYDLYSRYEVQIDKEEIVSQADPKEGKRYSCRKQSSMHGGSKQHMLPEKDGRITLIRFHPGKRNPDAPDILDHRDQYGIEERVNMLRQQDGALPVYKFVYDGAWEHIGYYRVKSITDDSEITAERSRICGRPIRYVIQLERDTT